MLFQFFLLREGVGLQQGFFGLQQVLGAHGKAPQAQLQVLGGVGRVAHGKAADRHRNIALFGGVHHHPDELFHGFAGRAVVVLRRSQLPVHRVGILGQVVGADDEEAAAMGHKFFRRQAGRGHTEHNTERGILIERDAPLPQALAAPLHHLHGGVPVFHVRHHGEHDPQRAPGRRPHEGADLRFKLAGVAQAVADIAVLAI